MLNQYGDAQFPVECASFTCLFLISWTRLFVNSIQNIKGMERLSQPIEWNSKCVDFISKAKLNTTKFFYRFMLELLDIGGM